MTTVFRPGATHAAYIHAHRLLSQLSDAEAIDALMALVDDFDTFHAAYAEAARLNGRSVLA